METKSSNYTKETFPKKWAIELTYENRQIVGEWFDTHGQFGYNHYTEKSRHPYIGFPGIAGSHYFSNIDVKNTGYTIITFEDFKENILKINDKKVVGYKLKKECEQYIPAIDKIIGNDRWEEYAKNGEITFSIAAQGFYNNSFEGILEKAGVLSIWFDKVYREEKKTLTIGTSGIKVEVSKGKIVAEGKTIDANSLSKLVHDMNGSKQYNLPWNVGIGSSVIIGCSTFKQKELNSVLEAYDEINNTSFALLPF